MEFLNDFFIDVKDRLSSPFFSAFIITWLLFNWKVPIALAFDSADTIKAEGYKSFVDYIFQQVTTWSGVIYPLIGALFYTLVFPFIRNGILMVQAWYKKWGSERTLRISGTGVIPTSKYIHLREKYESQTKKLIDVITSESSFEEERKKLLDEVVLKTESIKKLQLKSEEFFRENDDLKAKSDTLLIEKIRLEDLYKKEKAAMVIFLEEHNQIKANLTNALDQKDKEIADLRTEIDTLQQRFYKISNSKKSDPEKQVEIVLDKILTQPYLAKSFAETGGKVLNKDTLSKQEEVIRDFTNMGLIEPINSTNHSVYKFTTIGKTVYDKLLLNLSK